MNFKDFTLTPLEESKLQEVKDFGDRWIGTGYFSDDELLEIYQASLFEGQSVSYLAYKAQQLVGIRLSLAPKRWDKLITKGLSEGKWRVSRAEVGYFKSLFIASSAQGQGLGKKLSELSQFGLENAGAKAILCHSWLESPKNSSYNYLTSFGFELVTEHEKYWYDVDYHCTRCGPQKCICTAAEMIKYLEKK